MRISDWSSDVCSSDLLGSGAVLLIPVGIAMLVALSVFGSLVKAPTAEGRKLLDQIEGFRRYLGVAERDELAGMEGPDAPPALDATRYERLQIGRAHV